jgi:hypothetical protein
MGFQHLTLYAHRTAEFYDKLRITDIESLDASSHGIFVEKSCLTIGEVQNLLLNALAINVDEKSRYREIAQARVTQLYPQTFIFSY